MEQKPSTAPASSGAEADHRSAAKAAGGFYEDADLRQRLNLLRHLVQSTDMIVLVLGEPGLGKSAWLAQLARKPDAGWQFCALQAEEGADAPALLAQLARCCDLPTDCGRPGLDYLLADHAGALARSARTPVVAVDDAHRAGPEALRALIDLTVARGGEAAAWRLVLFGEPALEEQVAALALPADLHGRLYALTIPALSLEQTEGYLTLRLAASGWEGPPPWSAEALRSLHRDTGGRPAALEQWLAERLAGAAAPQEAEPAPPASSPPRRSRRPWRLAVGGLGVLALAAVLLFQDRINRWVDGEPGSWEPLALPEQPAAPVDPVPEPTPPKDVDLTETAAAPDPPPGGPDERPAPPSPGEHSAVASAAGPAPAAENPAPDAAAPAPEEPQTSPAIVQADATEPAPPTAAPRPEDPQPVDDPQAAAATAADPSPAAEPDRTGARDTAAAPAAQNGDDESDWLLTRPPDHYTLQVLGSRSAETVRNTIRRFALQDAAFYTVQYRGDAYHVLVQGDYASRDDASRAIRRLPAELRKAGPWPRRFAAVQQEARSGVK